MLQYDRGEERFREVEYLRSFLAELTRVLAPMAHAGAMIKSGYLYGGKNPSFTFATCISAYHYLQACGFVQPPESADEQEWAEWREKLDRFMVGDLGLTEVGYRLNHVRERELRKMEVSDVAAPQEEMTELDWLVLAEITGIGPHSPQGVWQRLEQDRKTAGFQLQAVVRSLRGLLGRGMALQNMRAGWYSYNVTEHGALQLKAHRAQMSEHKGDGEEQGNAGSPMTTEPLAQWFLTTEEQRTGLIERLADRLTDASATMRKLVETMVLPAELAAEVPHSGYRVDYAHLKGSAEGPAGQQAEAEPAPDPVPPSLAPVEATILTYIRDRSWSERKLFYTLNEGTDRVMPEALSSALGHLCELGYARHWRNRFWGTRSGRYWLNTAGGFCDPWSKDPDPPLTVNEEMCLAVVDEALERLRIIDHGASVRGMVGFGVDISEVEQARATYLDQRERLIY